MDRLHRYFMVELDAALAIFFKRAPAPTTHADGKTALCGNIGDTFFSLRLDRSEDACLASK